MSWDRMEYKEYAVCKCGKGRVVRHYIEKMMIGTEHAMDVLVRKLNALNVALIIT